MAEPRLSLRGLRAVFGDVLLDGRSMRDLPAERRPVSLVFQKPLLFPHLSVQQNVAFGLRLQGRRAGTRADVRRVVAEMLERVRLGDLGGRRVGERSPAAKSSGSRWPAPWCCDPGCCCWTSRSRSSPPTCATRCGPWCAQCTTRRG